LTIIGIYGIIESEKFVEYCMFRGGSVMKSTGIVRKVDELGRVVLPIELRRNT